MSNNLILTFSVIGAGELFLFIGAIVLIVTAHRVYKGQKTRRAIAITLAVNVGFAVIALIGGLLLSYESMLKIIGKIGGNSYNVLTLFFMAFVAITFDVARRLLALSWDQVQHFGKPEL